MKSLFNYLSKLRLKMDPISWRNLKTDPDGFKKIKRGLPLSALQKAQIASIKFSKIGPWSEYGAARVKRGSETSLSNFGSSFRSASDEQKANRRSTGFTGRGMYGLRRSVGQFMKRNKTAQSFYDKGMGYAGMGLYTGRGLYSTNSLVDSPKSRPSMEFSSPNDESQSLIISHKEYVGDIFGPSSNAFSNIGYNINPGLTQNFPFLAQFAQNFDEYELIQMVWEFHSTVDASAVNNSSGNTGTIVMATNYKADASLFSTKEEMIQYHGGVSGRLTEDLTHGVECDPSKLSLGTGKFVRTSLVNNSDIKTFDMGIFQLAVQNIPTAFVNQQIGELWVYYKVKLSKPKLYQALGNGASSFRAVSSGSETITAVLGNSILTAQSNSLPCTVRNSTVTPVLVGYTVAASPAAILYTPTARGIQLTFPASAAGVFSIKVYGEGVALGMTDGPQWALMSTTSGGNRNISAWSDIYGVSAAGDTPEFQAYSFNAGTTIQELRVRVQASTGGVDNNIWLYPFGGGATGNPSQTYIEVVEIGNQFQTNNSIANPVFVNSVGTIVSV